MCSPASRLRQLTWRGLPDWPCGESTVCFMSSRKGRTGSWGCLGWFITLGMGGVIALCAVLPIFAAVVSANGSDNLGRSVVQALLALSIAVLMVSLGGVLVTRNNEARRNQGRPASYDQRTSWRRRWSVLAMVSCGVVFLLCMAMAALSASS